MGQGARGPDASNALGFTGRVVRSVGTYARLGVKVAALPLGVGSRRRPGDVTIMCYHRVGVGEREIDVPAGRFDDHLETLASEGAVRSLDEALDRGGVVLSFDDGFRDFHEVVLPRLVRHRMPGLLYLATGFVDTGDPRTDVGQEQALTWSMLEEAVSTGLVTVGSHTHAHVDLSSADDRTSRAEMQMSKSAIEDRLGVSCEHFAFPWGKASAAAESAARACFRTAAREGWKTNRAGRIDLHRLGRTPVLRSDSGFFFRAKARGQLDGERLAYRALRRGPWAPS
jgi:peptidoglycan/xylan/chitin deacetylase (PgdA/CDA1 family)